MSVTDEAPAPAPPISNESEKAGKQTRGIVDDFENSPTDEQLRDLVHVADRVPYQVWLVILVGSAERFVFYRVSTCLQNYLQNSPNNLVPGTLGLGQSKATTINYTFIVLVNTTPIPLAIIADGWLGRYKLILYSTLYVNILLFCSALASVVQHKKSLLTFDILAASTSADLAYYSQRLSRLPWHELALQQPVLQYPLS
mgnify:CR=1 FL=1